MTALKLTIKDLQRAFERMYLIRRAEEQIADLYLKNKIMSFVHFYIGQEAVAVGVCDSLKKEDKVFGNHRSHGHYLAKGGSLNAMVAELLGKEPGLAKGKGGSMHMIDTSVGFAGSTPILGSAVPLACGSAFEQKFNKKKQMTAVFLGDGAFEEGAVMETINLAGLFRLPLLLVVENNLFAVNTALEDRRAPNYSAARLVSGLGARYMKANGNDYKDVRSKCAKLVEHIRSGRGPAVLECIVYRHMAHSAPIFDESSRKRDVLKKRQKEDSVQRLRADLLRSRVSERVLKGIEDRVARVVGESIQFATDAPYPKKQSLLTDLYAR